MPIERVYLTIGCDYEEVLFGEGVLGSRYRERPNSKWVGVDLLQDN